MVLWRGWDMTSRVDVAAWTLASLGTPLVKMANDGIDPEQREADDKGHGKDSGIENHVSGLGHIRYQQLAKAGHASSLPGAGQVSSIAP